MQQLQNASECERCARNILEAVLSVMVAMRETAARRQRRGKRGGGDGTSLMHIRTMGVLLKRPGATLSAVADQLALTLSATSRLVDGLVAKGLVKRMVPPGNRRTVSLMLSAAGRKKLEACLRESQEEVAAQLRTLSPRQLQQMTDSMEALRGLFENSRLDPFRVNK